VVDIMPSEGEPAEHYQAIRGELTKYSKTLAEKPELIVANKMDLTDSEEASRAFREALGQDIVTISAVTGRSLDPLLERIWALVDVARQQAEAGEQ